MIEAYALRSTGPGRTLVLRAAIGITGSDSEKRTGWANIARCGEWKGHPAGEFQITPEHLKACVEYFEAQANPVVFDFEHAATLEGAKAPAAGWIQKLKIEGDKLWALVEWTEEAAGYIRAGQYRYSSAVLFFDAPDRKSGEPLSCRLHSAALTNTPFVDGLNAIALSDKARMRSLRMSVMIKKNDLLKALEALGESEMSPEMITKIAEVLAAKAAPEEEPAAPEMKEPEKVPEEKKKMPEDEKKLSEPAAPAVAAAEPAGDPMAMLAARLVEASGMSAEELVAAIESNLEAVIAAIKGGGGMAGDAMASKLAAADAMIKSLSDRVTAFEKRDAEAERAKLVAEVDALVTERKLTEDAKPAMLALAEKDAASFRALASKLPTAYPKGLQVAGTPAVKQEREVDLKHPRVLALCEQYKRAGVVITEKNKAHYPTLRAAMED